MTSIQLTLTGAFAQAEVTGVLTAGMVGLPVIIKCDSAWDGLVKTLVCRSSVASKAVENVGRRTTVASGVMQWEPLERNELFLGLEGRDAEGNLVIPSTMAYCGVIQPSTDLPKVANQESIKETTQYINTPDTVAWHQCPEAARRFVEEVTYDPADYSQSLIADYAPAVPGKGNDKPVGKTIGDKTFYNEVPDVKTDFVAGDAFGTIQPVDQVRFINTPCAPNVRDLGGWVCDGGTVKYGLLFRGGCLNAADRPVLVEELGVRHDLDLRGATEDWVASSPLGKDIHFTRAKAYNWYSLTNTEAWQINLRCIFDAVIHNEPVYFHCTAGADRTGTLACVLEGLLGVSQSDIDKDYELTCFWSGTGADSTARRRNEEDWYGLISKINAKQGTTFRDKCVTFVTELGFTAEQINEFRAAMINGSPEKVVPEVEQLKITTALTEGLSSDNTITALPQYQPYEAKIECEPGYVIQSVHVTMGGKNITGSSWKGTVTNLQHSVKFELENCFASNAQLRVIDGQGYVTTITADSKYTLVGADIHIMMGGQDMTNHYYSNGVIAIPQVTADVQITIVAAGKPAEQENQMVVKEGNLNKRISGLNTPKDYNGCFICEPIAVDLTKSCPVTFKNFAGKMGALASSDAYGQSKVLLLDADKTPLAIWYIGTGATSEMNSWNAPVDGADCVGDLAELLTKTGLVSGSIPTAEQVAYVQFAPQISTEAIVSASLNGLEILLRVI